MPFIITKIDRKTFSSRRMVESEEKRNGKLTITATTVEGNPNCMRKRKEQKISYTRYQEQICYLISLHIPYYITSM